MKQTVYYQKGYGNWHKRTDEVPFFKYWWEQIGVYRHIILPYYWNRIKTKLGLQD